MEGPDRWGEPLSPSELFAAESFGSRCAKRDGVIWLSLGGELDVFTAPKLREALDQAMPGSGETLVLDLRGLSFIDSSGLAVVLGAHERITGSDDGELHIVIAGSAPVEALFETIGAADYLPLLDDPQTFTSVSGA